MKKRGSEGKLEKLLADFTESLTRESSQGVEEIGSLSKDLGSSSARIPEDPSSCAQRTEKVLSLFETVRTISSVIQPKQPSEAFIARVSYATQQRMLQRLQEHKLTLQSTEKIQRIIGMAVTVEDFRRSLFHDIVAACRSAGFNLTPKEIAALRSLKEDAVKEFANSLDERITKFFPTNLP
jgi:hypothetical protein